MGSLPAKWPHWQQLVCACSVMSLPALAQTRASATFQTWKSRRQEGHVKTRGSFATQNPKADVYWSRALRYLTAAAVEATSLHVRHLHEHLPADTIPCFSHRCARFTCEVPYTRQSLESHLLLKSPCSCCPSGLRAESVALARHEVMDTYTLANSRSFSTAPVAVAPTHHCSRQG